MRNGSAKVCPQCNEVKHLSEFRDNSLVTGIGRFCLSCKTAPKMWRHAIFEKTPTISENEPTKKDINKLLSFSENPEKYATGTPRSKEKVNHLESVKHLFSEGQLATYERARAMYDDKLDTVVKDRSTKKVDYSEILNEAYTQHKSLKICYKGVWRIIDPYSLNNTYISGYCHKARDMRTFRIDRMQGAEVSDSFDFDQSVQTTAVRKMAEAPRYRGSRY